MAALNPPDAPGLALLLNRRSHHQLRAPGPNDDELNIILRAGLRAPDFALLRPYRVLAARDAGLTRLGETLRQGALAAGLPERRVARAASMPLRAPLVLTVIACPRAHDTVPEFDQLLCAGSVVLCMQLAARALGYGGVWRSGWPMHQPEVGQALGLAPHERIIGFLYLGTADGEPPARAEPDLADFLRWL